MKPPFETPWTVAVWLPSGCYHVLASFPDRAAAVSLAADAPGRVVLFRPAWRMARHDDF